MILVLNWRLLFLLTLMFLHLDCHWLDSGSELEAPPAPSSLSGSATKTFSIPGFSLVLPSSSSFIFHLSSDSVALPLGFTGPSRDVSSSHKDQTLASNMIEESREFKAIVQLTDSAPGSSVVSSGAQFVNADTTGLYHRPEVLSHLDSTFGGCRTMSSSLTSRFGSHLLVFLWSI